MILSVMCLESCVTMFQLGFVEFSSILRLLRSMTVWRMSSISIADVYDCMSLLMY